MFCLNRNAIAAVPLRNQSILKILSGRTVHDFIQLRVDAILRRAGQEESSLSVGGIVIDKTAHIVTIDGEPVELSVKEFELLSFFVENKGVALSREKILNNVWNYDYYGDARTIDTHVKKLRSKMGAKGDFIKTIWGMGYKFEPQD